MRNKKLFLLAIAAASTFASCDFLNEKEEPLTEEEGSFEEVNTNPTSTEKKEEDKDSEESSDSSNPSEPAGEKEEEEVVDLETVDYSKNSYTLTWDTGDETIVQNNISRGEYPQFGEIPVKTSKKAGMMNHFVGWSKNAKASSGLEESELSPVIRDTTYHALYEEVESCKVQIYDSFSFYTGYGNLWKEFDVPKGSKITSAQLDFDSIPLPAPSNSEKIPYFSHIANYQLFSQLLEVTDDVEHKDYCYDKLEDIPTINEDTKLTLQFDESSKKYTVSFYNQGNLYTGKAFEGTMSYAKGQNINVGYSEYGTKLGIFRMPDPVKISNGKMHTFLGWNTNPNATSGTLTKNLSHIVEGDTNFYAIFSSTANTDAALTCYNTSNNGSLLAKSFDTVVNDGKFTVTNGVFNFAKSAYLSSNYSDMQVWLPDNKNITTIGTAVFTEYDVLTSIRLPSTLTSLPSDAFRGCSNLKSVDLSACTNLKHIPANAFSGCSNLVEIKGFTNYIQTIGDNAFSGCKKFKIPSLNKITSIGENAFEGTSGNSNGKVIIPSSVKSVGKEAFTGGTFSEVEIASGSISTLPILTFANNSNLAKVSIPSNLYNIDVAKTAISESECNHPFQGCDNISSLVINSSNSNYYSYKNTIIKKSNQSLVCGGVNSIISDNVQIINGYAFYKSAIKRIRIPSSVVVIDKNAFCDSKLSRVDYDGTKDKFDNSLRKAFKELGQEVKVHCLDGVLSSNDF